jgi:hypothetical protein
MAEFKIKLVQHGPTGDLQATFWLEITSNYAHKIIS